MPWLILIILFGLTTVFLFYSFFESYWLRVKKIDFADQDIPANFNNKKIVFISDIHQNYFFPRSKLRHVVEQANKIEPDGGQITFFGLWAPTTSSNYGQKYRTGLVDAPQTKTIVSHGVGTALFPLRFFSRPEIIMVNLVKQ